MTPEERDSLLSKLRFLVQSKAISNEAYLKILGLPVTERTEEVIVLAHLLSGLILLLIW